MPHNVRVHEAGLGRRVDLTAGLFAALAAPAHRQLAPLLCRCPRRLVHFGCVRRGRDEPPRMPNPSRGRRSVDCCACRLALILGVSTSPASMPAERPARVRRRMPLLRRCSARTASVHEPCWHLLHTLHIQSQPPFPHSLRRCLQGVPLPTERGARTSWSCFRCLPDLPFAPPARPAPTWAHSAVV